MKKLVLPLIVFVSLVGDSSNRSITAASNASPIITSWLGNISTRCFVQTGDNVMIGGFIIQGTQPKRVIIRAIGPELGAPPYNVPSSLADPTLELHDGTGALIASNDNWQHTIIGGIITGNQVQDIMNSSYAPGDPRESAIIAELPAGNYTAIVRGANNTTGVALVEGYDLSPDATSILHNISTRAFVQTADNVMIGGFIVKGTQPKRVIVRAIGPSLTEYGVPNALSDPTLELHDGAGALIASNDDWERTSIGGIITADQVRDITYSGLAPGHRVESAIVATLSPGNHTAIVRGKNNTTGVALVEVYDLDPQVLETASQLIPASQGGTITLPSNNSVTIPAGALPSDQVVTLSLLWSMPGRPPSGLIVPVGPALSLSFTHTNSIIDEKRVKQPSSGPIQFHLDFSNSTAAGFEGSAPLGKFFVPQSVGPSPIFSGLDGQVDLAHRNATISFDPQNLQGGIDLSTITVNVGLANIAPEKHCAAPTLGGKYWNGSAFRNYSCSGGLPPGFNPNAKTLILVHGMASSVETAFGEVCRIGSSAVNKITTAGNYSQALGFDYDWTQGVVANGQRLGQFLDCLRQRGFTNIDVEAHSEGVPVALSAASQSSLSIGNMVLLGGPITGTPLANIRRTVENALLYTGGPGFCVGNKLLGDILGAPFASDLQSGSGVLVGVAVAFNQRAQHPNVLTVAGDQAFDITQFVAEAALRQAMGPTDGVIPVSSALGQDSGLLNLTEVGTFHHKHTDLGCSDDIVQAVGNLVNSPGPTPTPGDDCMSLCCQLCNPCCTARPCPTCH
jgi:pimeloyl-ACP methyl ester carboxylesterase